MKRTGLRPSWARDPKPAKPDPITPEVRRAVQARSKGRCECCGADGQHLHHRQLRRFGNHTATNLINVCLLCHRRIHTGHRAEATEAGWLLSSHDDPATVPVVAAGRRVLLSASGEYRELREAS